MFFKVSIEANTSQFQNSTTCYFSHMMQNHKTCYKKPQYLILTLLIPPIKVSNKYYGRKCSSPENE